MHKIAFFAAAALAVTVTAASGQKAEAHSTQAKKSKPHMVAIKSGDSLSKIAKRHNTTYPRLYFANPDIKHPDVIYVGDEVRVPDKDEKLKKRPLPGENLAGPTGNRQSSANVSYTKQKQNASVNYQYSAPKSYSVPAPAPANVSGSVWDRMAQCESGGNWAINTGNGYYGGLQFTLSTWQAVGGSGYPHQASKAEQIKRGQILQARSGWGQWPACASMLGLI